MNTELAAAAIIATLGLLQVLLPAIEYRRVHGVAYANTARDAPPPKPDSVLYGRLSRAQANLMETAPYFIALALIITVAGSSSSMTRIAAMVFVAARILYVPLYAMGTPYVRGLVWTISYAALAVLAIGALTAINWAFVLQV